MKCPLNIYYSIKCDVYFLKSQFLFMSLASQSSLRGTMCLSCCPVVRNDTDRGDPEPDKESGLPFHFPCNSIPRIAFLMPIR